jgi:hypothetical protein
LVGFMTGTSLASIASRIKDTEVAAR